MSSQTRHSIAAILALVVGLWAVPARAELITVDWDVVPHEAGQTDDDNSPFYQCFGIQWTNRTCQFLWEQGLELGRGQFYPLYDDKFLDSTGLEDDEPFSGPFFPSSGLLKITPVCKSGLEPCFDSFTPVALRVFRSGPHAANLFVVSSRGGLVKVPSLDNPNDDAIALSGSEWENIAWLSIGIYRPDVCDEDPELDCPSTETAITVDYLTFSGHPAAVPEPALAALIGTAITAALGRRGISVRRRRNR